MPIPGGRRTLAAELPACLADVPHRGLCSPFAANSPDALRSGANCQSYAFAVLAHFGVEVPPLRAGALWTDARLQTVTGPTHELDLVLFGPDSDPFGAHVGVVVGPDAVLHLCPEVGSPVVWPEAAFTARAVYRVRLGARRVGSRTDGCHYEPAPL